MDAARGVVGSSETGEAFGLPAEVRELVASVAGAALEAGRVEEAEKVLEGLVAVHPREAAAWALLARAHLRTGKALAARFAAEVALQLAPGDPQARLARAEVRVGSPEERGAGVQELRGLRTSAGPVGERARALLAALGAEDGG